MSHVIKFRAWDTKNEEMVEFPYGFAEMFGYFSNTEQMDRLHRLEWMQFTGLLDKDGKEIYEGDVFTYAGATKPCGPVEWDEKLLMWHVKDSVMLWALRKDAEVIGNIYEHPELL